MEVNKLFYLLFPLLIARQPAGWSTRSPTCLAAEAAMSSCDAVDRQATLSQDAPQPETSSESISRRRVGSRQLVPEAVPYSL